MKKTSFIGSGVIDFGGVHANMVLTIGQDQLVEKFLDDVFPDRGGDPEFPQDELRKSSFVKEAIARNSLDEALKVLRAFVEDTEVKVRMDKRTFRTLIRQWNGCPFINVAEYKEMQAKAERHEEEYSDLFYRCQGYPWKGQLGFVSTMILKSSSLSKL